MAGPIDMLAGIGLFYNDPAAGLRTNKAWKKRAEIRQAASQSVKDKNDIIKEHELLLKQIENHEISKSRETATSIIRTLQDGLQKTYDVMFEELLLLKDKLEKDETFLKNNAKKFTKEDLQLYHDKFLINVSIALDEIRLNMVSDLINSIRYNGFGAYRIETINNKKSFVGRMFEVMHMKGMVKGLYKEEGNVSILEEGGRFRDLLEENNIYYTDFVEITKKMLLYDLILISHAYNTADSMQKAINSFDLIQSYSAYPDAIMTLLQDDAVKAFRNINKSLIQLRSMLQKSAKSVNKLIMEKRKDGNNTK